MGFRTIQVLFRHPVIGAEVLEEEVGVGATGFIHPVVWVGIDSGIDFRYMGGRIPDGVFDILNMPSGQIDQNQDKDSRKEKKICQEEMEQDQQEWDQ